ncbi:MAG: hypothetical protein AAF554_16845 [Bacteroidota bacterium]
MASIIEPPKKGITYSAPKLKYLVNNNLMKNFKLMMINNQATNFLNEAPNADKVYRYNNKNYGRPEFRLLPEEASNGIPGQQGFRFTKDKENKLHLNIIVEAYSSETNVIPLEFSATTIVFQYENANGDVELPLSITQTLPIQDPYPSKHLYAHALVDENDKEAIYEALVSGNKKSKLTLKSEIWWQKPTVNKPKPAPSRPAKPRVIADTCQSFNRNALRVQGNNVFSGSQKLLSFRNRNDALRAVQAIRHYKMDKRCNVGGNQFTYFLSGNNPPTGKIKGEDCLPFNPARLKVTNAKGRWKITDGRSWMFDFGASKTNAERALKIIKKHGFDATCYIGRPKPGMTYLKRTRPPMLHLMNAVAFKPLLALKMKDASTVADTPSKPQKVDLNSEIHLFFERKDASIFQGFFDELESKEYKWHREEKIDFQNPGFTHSYYYRLTNDPNKVFFLPQVYRIGVNHETGEPRMNINLYEHEKESGHKEYRINMTFHIEPYFHPRAKKDLMNHLFGLSEGKIKYVENLVLGGYRKVSFELEDRFLSDNALFSEKFTEKAEEIDPSAGFTITADHSLESFEVFKKELLTNGIDIGKIYFELEEETQEGVVFTQSKPITVELSFKKLENIPLSVENLSGANGKLASAPAGFYLKNNTKTPVTVEGVELTLLSSTENFVYSVDFDLGTEGISWPLTIAQGKKEGIFIDQSDVDQLTDENMVWNNLVCEPHGIRANIDPDKIMASVIDHATGDPQMWELKIAAPLYENWENWSEEQKEPYKEITGVIVEIKTEDSEITSVRLDRHNPNQVVKMARTVQQLLKSTQHENRKYQFRQTNITLTQSKPGIWKSSENTSMEHLLVYPEIEQIDT